MSDQPQNPTMIPPAQNPPPADIEAGKPAPNPVSVNPAPAAETPAPATPPTTGVGTGGPASAEDSAGKQAAAPMAAVEPVPLPKATDVEAPAQSPPPADIEAGKPAEINSLFEKPETVGPGQKEEGKGKKEDGHKLPKGVVAGVAALVFLVSGLSIGVYVNSQHFGIFDLRRYAADNMCNVNPGSCRTEQDWIDGYYAAREPENSNATPNQPEFTNARDDQNKNEPGQQVEIIRDVGQSGVGDPGSGNRTGEGYTLQEGSVQETKDASNNTIITVNLGKAIPFGGAIDYRGTPEGATSYPTGDQCSGLDERQARDCLANTKSGLFTSGGCVGMTIQQCQEWARTQGYSLQYCSGNQEAAGTARAGEFLNCGGQSTNGCGQIDVLDSSGNVKGFIIDKSSCAGGGIVQESVGVGNTGGGEETGTNPAATSTPVTISANCESLVGQVSDGASGWTSKTDSEFAATARPGDRVRFVCTGHKTQGNFTKSAFFINNVLHVDDVVKLNETQFAVEYTIGAAGALKVESVLLHDSKGWVD